MIHAIFADNLGPFGFDRAFFSTAFVGFVLLVCIIGVFVWAICTVRPECPSCNGQGNDMDPYDHPFRPITKCWRCKGTGRNPDYPKGR